MTGADSVGLRLVEGVLDVDGLGLSVIVVSAVGVSRPAGWVAAAELEAPGLIVECRLNDWVRLTVFDVVADTEGDADALRSGIGEAVGDGVIVATDCDGAVLGVGPPVRLAIGVRDPVIDAVWVAD